MSQRSGDRHGGLRETRKTARETNTSGIDKVSDSARYIKGLYSRSKRKATHKIVLLPNPSGRVTPPLTGDCKSPVKSALAANTEEESTSRRDVAVGSQQPARDASQTQREDSSEFFSLDPNLQFNDNLNLTKIKAPVTPIAPSRLARMRNPRSSSTGSEPPCYVVQDIEGRPVLRLVTTGFAIRQRLTPSRASPPIRKQPRFRAANQDSDRNLPIIEEGVEHSIKSDEVTEADRYEQSKLRIIQTTEESRAKSSRKRREFNLAEGDSFQDLERINQTYERSAGDPDLSTDVVRQKTKRSQTKDRHTAHRKEKDERFFYSAQKYLDDDDDDEWHKEKRHRRKKTTHRRGRDRYVELSNSLHKKLHTSRDVMKGRSTIEETTWEPNTTQSADDSSAKKADEDGDDNPDDDEPKGKKKKKKKKGKKKKDKERTEDSGTTTPPEDIFAGDDAQPKKSNVKSKEFKTPDDQQGLQNTPIGSALEIRDDVTPGLDKATSTQKKRQSNRDANEGDAGKTETPAAEQLTPAEEKLFRKRSKLPEEDDDDITKQASLPSAEKPKKSRESAEKPKKSREENQESNAGPSGAKSEDFKGAKEEVSQPPSGHPSNDKAGDDRKAPSGDKSADNSGDDRKQSGDKSADKGGDDKLNDGSGKQSSDKWSDGPRNDDSGRPSSDKWKDGPRSDDTSRQQQQYRDRNRPASSQKGSKDKDKGDDDDEEDEELGSIVYQNGARYICIGALRVAGGVRVLFNMMEKQAYIQIISPICEVFITYYANNMTFLTSTSAAGVAWAAAIYVKKEKEDKENPDKDRNKEKDKNKNMDNDKGNVKKQENGKENGKSKKKEGSVGEGASIPKCNLPEASKSVIDTAHVIFCDPYQAQRLRTVLETLKSATDCTIGLVTPCIFPNERHPNFPCPPGPPSTMVDPTSYQRVCQPPYPPPCIGSVPNATTFANCSSLQQLARFRNPVLQPHQIRYCHDLQNSYPPHQPMYNPSFNQPPNPNQPLQSNQSAYDQSYNSPYTPKNQQYDQSHNRSSSRTNTPYYRSFYPPNRSRNPSELSLRSNATSRMPSSYWSNMAITGSPNFAESKMSVYNYHSQPTSRGSIAHLSDFDEPFPASRPGSGPASGPASRASPAPYFPDEEFLEVDLTSEGFIDPYSFEYNSGKILFCAPACLVRLSADMIWTDLQKGTLKIYQCPGQGGYSIVLENNDRAISKHQYLTADTLFVPSEKTQFGFTYNTATRSEGSGNLIEHFLVSFMNSQVAELFKCVVDNIRLILESRVDEWSGPDGEKLCM